jgi:hypothetical protein
MHSYIQQMPSLHLILYSALDQIGLNPFAKTSTKLHRMKRLRIPQRLRIKDSTPTD